MPYQYLIPRIYPAPRMPVTARLMTFFVGNLYVSGWGVDPTYPLLHNKCLIYITFYLNTRPYFDRGCLGPLEIPMKNSSPPGMLEADEAGIEALCYSSLRQVRSN